MLAEPDHQAPTPVISKNEGLERSSTPRINDRDKSVDSGAPAGINPEYLNRVLPDARQESPHQKASDKQTREPTNSRRQSSLPSGMDVTPAPNVTDEDLIRQDVFMDNGTPASQVELVRIMPTQDRIGLAPNFTPGPIGDSQARSERSTQTSDQQNSDLNDDRGLSPSPEVSFINPLLPETSSIDRRPRDKPQCWDHGCNGREFSTFSNLLRHQRAMSGSAVKVYCPHCGAEFTRVSARISHIRQGKCVRLEKKIDIGHLLSEMDRSFTSTSLIIHDPRSSSEHVEHEMPQKPLKLESSQEGDRANQGDGKSDAYFGLEGNWCTLASVSPIHFRAVTRMLYLLKQQMQSFSTLSKALPFNLYPAYWPELRRTIDELARDLSLKIQKPTEEGLFVCKAEGLMNDIDRILTLLATVEGNVDRQVIQLRPLYTASDRIRDRWYPKKSLSRPHALWRKAILAVLDKRALRDPSRPADATASPNQAAVLFIDCGHEPTELMERLDSILSKTLNTLFNTFAWMKDLTVI